jgi:phage I-like protein
MSVEPAEAEKPSRNFLKRLYDELKGSGDLTFDSFQSAVRKARAHAGGKAKAEKSKMASESLTDFIDRVQTALYQQFYAGWNGQAVFTYAREVFNDHVIACSNEDGKDYQIPYSTVNDEIVFGEPVEVEVEYVVVGFEQTEVADLCADGHGMRLFVEQSFADVPDWINYLPKPGTYTSPRYGKILITEERNQNFVANFQNKVYQQQVPVTIDAEHETKLSGAMGWFEEMRQNDDGSVDAKVGWTDRGKSLIEGDSYKYFSPEWFEHWTDPATEQVYYDVPIGGALTTRPFFKEKALRPLVANEQGISILDGDLKNLKDESVVVLNFTALAPIQPKGVTMAEEKKPGADKGFLAKLKEFIEGAEKEETASPAPKKAAETETVNPQAFSDLQTKYQAAETEAQTVKADLVKANERIGTLEKSARFKRFSEIAKDFLGETAKHLDFMEFLATSDEKGEESERFKDYVTQQTAIAAQAKTGNLFAEIGSSAPIEGGAISRIDAAAKKFREADPKLSEAMAFTMAWNSSTAGERVAYREEQRSVN